MSKGCAACHSGSHSLSPGPAGKSALKGMTLNDIAVAMWNHQPRMPASAPHLETGEMRELVSYLWAGQFFEDSGNAAAGEHVFAAKHCTNCHTTGSGQAFSGKAFSGKAFSAKAFTGATMV